MKKLGDKQIDFCEKCKTDRQFEISEISEYGEVFGRCNKCYNAIKLLILRIQVYPFEKMIQQSHLSARKEMSPKNYELFERYDRAMIGSVATTRRSQLVILSRLSRQINKDCDSRLFLISSVTEFHHSDY